MRVTKKYFGGNLTAVFPTIHRLKAAIKSGEGIMPKRKRAVKYAVRGEKDLWHPYGLQGLTTDRFALVVNGILRGRFDLLKLKYQEPIGSRGIKIGDAIEA